MAGIVLYELTRSTKSEVALLEYFDSNVRPYALAICETSPGRFVLKPSCFASGARSLAHRQLEHGIKHCLGAGACRKTAQYVGKPSIEQEHGETMHQRPGACDCRCLLERQPLLPDLLMAAGSDRAGQPRERGSRGLVQRGSRIIQALCAEHQPIHARMRLRVANIGLRSC